MKIDMPITELPNREIVTLETQKPKETKSISLSSEDKTSIKYINSKISTVPQDIIEMTADDVFFTLENGNPMNRVLRDESGQVIAYLGCEGEDGGEVYVKYLAAETGSLTKLRTEVIKFITRAKKLNYTKISFNGFNDDLNSFLTRFGFVETGNGMTPLFQLNLAETNVDTLKSRQLRQYVNFLENDTGASEVWSGLSPEEQTHITRLLALTIKDKTDPEINFLYGAISTLQKHDQNISKIKSIADLYAKSDNLLSTSEKQENANNYARWILRYLESSNNLNLQEEAIVSLQSELEAVMIKTNPSKYTQAIKETLEKYQIKAADEDGKEIQFNQNFLYGLNPDSPKTFIADIPNFDLTAYSLNNLKEMKRESAELNHCVGDSDFYIDKVREGKIKVISLRDKQGTPKYTLEYNINNKELVQFKGKDNELPEDKELIVAVLDQLEKSGFTIQKIDEDFDFGVMKDKQIGKTKIVDQIDKYCIMNYINKYDILTVLNPLELDSKDPEDFIIQVCENPNLGVNLTKVGDITKAKIKNIRGTLVDNSGYSPDYSSLETCGDISMENLESLEGFDNLVSCGNISMCDLRWLEGLNSLQQCNLINMPYLVELNGLGKLQNCGDISMDGLSSIVQGFDSLRVCGDISMYELEDIQNETTLFDNLYKAGTIDMPKPIKSRIESVIHYNSLKQ
jgi:hypothetical protein